MRLVGRQWHRHGIRRDAPRTIDQLRRRSHSSFEHMPAGGVGVYAAKLSPFPQRKRAHAQIVAHVYKTRDTVLCKGYLSLGRTLALRRCIHRRAVHHSDSNRVAASLMFSALRAIRLNTSLIRNTRCDGCA